MTPKGITYFKQKHFVTQLKAMGLYKPAFDGVGFETLQEMSSALQGTGYSYVVQVLPVDDAWAVMDGKEELVYRPRSESSEPMSPATLS